MANFLKALADGLTGGLTGLISSGAEQLLGTAFGGLNASTQNHYSRELMRYQSELQHNENQFWADYNSPLQQMERLKAAGLNPNLVYGNGATATAGGSVNPSATSSYRPASIRAIENANMIAQNQNLQAQNENLKEQAAKTREERIGQQIQNRKDLSAVPEEMGVLGKQLLRQQIKNETNKAAAAEFDALYKKLLSAHQEMENIYYKDFGEPMLRQQYYKADWENAILYIQNMNLPEQIAADLNVKYKTAQELSARIGQIAVLKKYYNTLADNEEKKRLGIEISNGIKALEYDMKLYGLSTKNDFTYILDSYINPLLNSLSTAVGAGAKAVDAASKFHPETGFYNY